MLVVPLEEVVVTQTTMVLLEQGVEVVTVIPLTPVTMVVIYQMVVLVEAVVALRPFTVHRLDIQTQSQAQPTQAAVAAVETSKDTVVLAAQEL
jgi:CTP:molybdopterin cytidylyltransferase MocA